MQNNFQKKLGIILNVALALYGVAAICFLTYGPIKLRYGVYRINIENLAIPIAVLLFFALAKFILYWKAGPNAHFLTGFSYYIARLGRLIINAFLLITGGVTVVFLIVGSFTVTIPVHIIIDDFSRLLGGLFLLALVRLYLPYFSTISGAMLRAVISGGDFVKGRLVVFGLFAVIGFLLFLRIWNLAQGLDYGVIHVDAGRSIDGVYDYLEGYYDKAIVIPLFGMHFVEWAVVATAWVERTVFNEFPDISVSYIALTARWLNVFYSVIIALVAYGVGAIIGRRDAGVFAAFLVAVSVTNNQMTKYLGADFPMIAFAALSVYFMTRNLKSENRSNYILAAIFFTISTMSKYSGVLTIFFIMAVYFKLHPGKEAFYHWRYLFWSGIAAFTVVLIGYPVFLTNGAEQLYVLTHREYGSWRGVVMEQSKLGAFFYNYAYNFWAFKGIIAPLPVLLFLVAAVFTLKDRRYRIFIIAPLLMFICGKIFKPNAVSYHFMHTIPLFAVAVGVGLLDAAKQIKPRIIRIGFLGALVLFLGLSAIQDNSMWGPETNIETATRWIANNATDKESASNYLFRTHYKTATDEHDGKYFVHAQNGQPWAYTLFRDLHEYVVLRNGMVLLTPQAQFPSNAARARLFPEQKEIVQTDLSFETKWKRNLIFFPETSVTRDIFAPKMGDTVALYVVNLSSFKNRVFGTIGDKRFEYALKPFETRTHIVVNPDRSFLNYGAYVHVSAGSEKRALWKIVMGEDDLGDFFMAQGKPEEATFHYLLSGSAFGALNAFLLETDEKKKRDIATNLKVIYPPLFAKTTLATWNEIAGYTDEFFARSMKRPMEAPNSNKGDLTKDGLTIAEEGVVYGPYISLEKGRYTYTARVEVSPDVKSFTFDISADFGRRRLFKKRFTKKDIVAGKLGVDFVVDRLVDGNIEFRFYDVKGGSLTFHNADISIDYLGDAKELYLQARKKLDNL